MFSASVQLAPPEYLVCNKLLALRHLMITRYRWLLPSPPVFSKHMPDKLISILNITENISVIKDE